MTISPPPCRMTPPSWSGASNASQTAKRACTVGLTSPMRWSYVYGDLDPVGSIDDIIAGATLYAGTDDGNRAMARAPADLPARG